MKAWLKGGLIGLGILVLIFVILMIPVSNKNYQAYYDSACSAMKRIDTGILDTELVVMVELCKNRGGCFNDCGSACPPKQKLTILESFGEEFQGCIELCVPQCVCPYGKSYDQARGCV